MYKHIANLKISHLTVSCDVDTSGAKLTFSQITIRNISEGGVGVGVAKPLGHLKHNRTNCKTKAVTCMQLCKVCLTETVVVSLIL